MSDDQLRARFSISVPPSMEAGSPADFVSIWHSPNSFVLDFIVLKRPPQPMQDEETGEVYASIETEVSARVRIPPEQAFRLQAALKTEGDRWLEETGRSEPPSGWLDPNSTASQDDENKNDD
jgi:hypothetical protein